MSMAGSPWQQRARALLACFALLVLLAGCAGDHGATERASMGDPAPSANAGSAAPSATGGTAVPADQPAAGATQGPPPANATAANPGGAPAGTFKPRAALDPNVKFEWPESSPGDGSQCQAGTYTGTFDCMFMDASGAVPGVEVSGPVSLTFTKSMDGEFLEISDGLFEAVANLFIGARANIQGKLDCSALTLNATILDGMWALGDPSAPLAPGGALSGDITGTLDPATGTLSGAWTFGDPALGSCPGTWSVTYAP
jgi:hypothetical protein